jgi:acetyl-CoA C-acetyltransferase
MVEVMARVRADPAALGVVTTVSGLLTKPGIGAWSARPDGRPPLVGDLADECAAATGVVDVVETLEEYEGDATVVTYTVTYDGMDPIGAVALCRVGEGVRCVAMSDDPVLAAHGTVDELVGAAVRVAGGRFELV